MISRIWHGWTGPANADRYEALLKEEIFAGIQHRQIPGLRSIQLLRREAGAETEFVTIMLFDRLDAVREFAGEDYEAAVVPASAQEPALPFRCTVAALSSEGGEARCELTPSGPQTRASRAQNTAVGRATPRTQPAIQGGIHAHPTHRRLVAAPDAA